MKKISKDKKQKLVLVVLVTLTAMAGIWFGVIRTQQRSLQDLARKKSDAEANLQKVVKAIKNKDKIQADLADASKNLGGVENQMASGDLYSWIYAMVRQFKLPYKVDLPQFSSVVTGNNTLLPRFPYRQATMTISGTGYYHDIGEFIAAMENQFPYVRLANLDIQQSQGTVNDREKLLFKMDVVCLVKSNEKN